MDNGHDFTSIWCTACGHEVRVPVRCKHRFCPVCSRTTASRARARISWILKNVEKTKSYSWKFVTFTVASAEDLEAQVDHLIKSFRKLRSRKLWKERCNAGVYVIELTHGEKGWHAHIHCLAYMSYIPQHWLSRLWKSISGAAIVDIRTARGNAVVSYITKYITTFDIPPQMMPEGERVLRDRRLWSPFGLAHDLNQAYVPELHRCPCCGQCVWISDRERQFLERYRSSA